MAAPRSCRLPPWRLRSTERDCHLVRSVDDALGMHGIGRRRLSVWSTRYGSGDSWQQPPGGRGTYRMARRGPLVVSSLCVRGRHPALHEATAAAVRKEPRASNAASRGVAPDPATPVRGVTGSGAEDLRYEGNRSIKNDPVLGRVADRASDAQDWAVERRGRPRPPARSRWTAAHRSTSSRWKPGGSLTAPTPRLSCRGNYAGSASPAHARIRPLAPTPAHAS